MSPGPAAAAPLHQTQLPTRKMAPEGFQALSANGIPNKDLKKGEQNTGGKVGMGPERVAVGQVSYWLPKTWDGWGPGFY